MTGSARAIVVGILAALVSLDAAPAAQSRQARATAAPAGNPSAHPPAREMIDETGRHVAVPATVERIVSLAPNLTEILYDLGAQDRLVGASNYSDYPPEANSKPRIGDPVMPNLEQVVALRPHLVLATTSINRLQTVQALEKLGIAVYATAPHSVEGMLESIQHIAAAVDAGAAGEALVTELRARLERLKHRLAGRPAKRVLFVVWQEPLISVGPDTFLADALHWAGAQSVVNLPQDWPRVSLEEVVRLNPEYFLLAGPHSQTPEKSAEELRSQRGWRDLEAVQKGRIAVIGEAIYRPSPRLLDAIEELARRLHPDAFAMKSRESQERE